jgi:hypothetical protein
MDGELTNRVAEEPLIAPVSLSVNQCFLQVPFSGRSFLYGGKKMKETGVSQFFNISNRISPKFLSGFNYERNAPGFIEANFIYSDQLTQGLLLYFREAKNWDQISAAVYTEYNFGNFYVDGYLYYEELEKPFVGVNLSYQQGFYQFYLESIWKDCSKQVIVVGDTVARRDQKGTLSFVGGVSFVKDKWSLVLEYLHRQEGCNSEEQRDFIDYFCRQEQGGEVPYSCYALLRNYLAVSCTYSIHPELKLGLSTILSFQPVGSNFKEYAAYEFSSNLRYMLNQNCWVTFYGQYLTGGEYGEFNNLSPIRQTIGLALSYMF